MTVYKLLIIFMLLFLICEMVIFFFFLFLFPPSPKCFLAGFFALHVPGSLLEFQLGSCSSCLGIGSVLAAVGDEIRAGSGWN